MIVAADIQKTLELELIHAGSNKRLNIEFSDINRPGLQLAGFWDYFPHERPQVLGKVEMTYLEQLEPLLRYERLKRFMSYDPAVRDNLPQHTLSAGAAQGWRASGDVWIFSSSSLPTSRLVLNLTNYLNNRLAPRITRHGVLVDVYGVGIMITGESGVGKSEAALELVKRGHRLVADDVVDIKRVSDRRLIGESPEVVRHFMEIRGIGIIDISAMYGIGSVIHSKSIDMVVNLELWKKGQGVRPAGPDRGVHRTAGRQGATAGAADTPGTQCGDSAGSRGAQLPTQAAGLQRGARAGQPADEPHGARRATTSKPENGSYTCMRRRKGACCILAWIWEELT